MWIYSMLGEPMQQFFDWVGMQGDRLTPAWMDDFYGSTIGPYVNMIPWSHILSTIVIGGLTIGFLDDVASGRG